MDIAQLPEPRLVTVIVIPEVQCYNIAQRTTQKIGRDKHYKGYPKKVKIGHKSLLVFVLVIIKMQA